MDDNHYDEEQPAYTLLPFGSSIKRVQSEMGVSGEPSPNAELFQAVATTLVERFKPRLAEPADHDCFFFAADCHLGQRLDDNQDARHTSGYLTIAGSNADLINIFCRAFAARPELMQLMTIAMKDALQILINQREQPQPPETT